MRFPGSALAPFGHVRPSVVPQWLASVPALLAKAIAGPPTPAERLGAIPVRVLRSTFQRGDETLICELALNEREAHYELRTSGPPVLSLAGMEKFCSVLDAFERQSAMEAALLKEGWRLERHESFLT